MYFYIGILDDVLIYFLGTPKAPQFCTVDPPFNRRRLYFESAPPRPLVSLNHFGTYV
jgi:hypothetical protein